MEWDLLSTNLLMSFMEYLKGDYPKEPKSYFKKLKELIN